MFIDSSPLAWLQWLGQKSYQSKAQSNLVCDKHFLFPHPSAHAIDSSLAAPASRAGLSLLVTECLDCLIPTLPAPAASVLCQSYVSPCSYGGGVERQFWVKDGVTVIKDEGFRWGYWTYESDEQPDIDPYNPDGYELMSTDYDWEMESIPSGLSESVKQFVQQGGSVFIIPGNESNIPEYNELLKSLQLGTFNGKAQQGNQVAALS